MHACVEYNVFTGIWLMIRHYAHNTREMKVHDRFQIQKRDNMVNVRVCC
jgi:hypothetical protein